MKIRVKILAMGLGVAVLCGSARAAPPPDGGLDLPLEGAETFASWRSIPSGDQFWREYPPLASMLNLSGSATVSCMAETDGRLDDCSVVHEAPEGMGFGAAALRLTPYFNMKPATRDGRPIASHVQVPVKFALRSNTPPPAEPEPAVDPAAMAIARQVVDREGVEAELKREVAVNMQQVTTHSVVDGNAADTQAWLDAYRLALGDAVGAEVERQTRQLAGRMSKPELQATLAYLDSPAGKALMAAQQWSREHPPEVNFYSQAAQAAKVKFCATHACDGQTAGAASTPHGG